MRHHGTGDELGTQRVEHFHVDYIIIKKHAVHSEVIVNWVGL